MCPNPECESSNTIVIDSRESTDGRTVLRRRSCLACHQRFSTVERVEILQRAEKCQPEPEPTKTDVEPLPEPEPEPVPVAPVVIVQEAVPPLPPAHKSPTYTFGNSDRQTKRQIIDDLRARYRDARRCANGF